MIILLAGLIVAAFSFVARPFAKATKGSSSEGSPEGMVWIPGGTFVMGAHQDSLVDARPLHRVTVDGFWMNRTEVTNDQFERFVRETGYVTIAERKPDPRTVPGVPGDMLVPGCSVFVPPAGKASLEEPLSWWRYVPGANWRHPYGESSNIHGLNEFQLILIG